MHDDEVLTDESLVRRLLSEQHPQWADLPLALVPSYGTDHDVYRLGDHLALRLPRIGWADAQAAKEATWLPRLAPYLPLALPVQLARGNPTGEYPFTWSVCEWLPGESLVSAALDLDRAAVDLAGFVRALRGAPTHGAFARKPHARGGPLAETDEDFRATVAAAGSMVDGARLLRAWERAVEVPAYDGPHRWVHGDLLPGNVLAHDGRVSAVIDWGGLNVGDPACDLQPAWRIFRGSSRDRFRAEVDVDDATWERGRGWVLMSVFALPYYRDTNPGMVGHALHAIGEALADAG